MKLTAAPNRMVRLRPSLSPSQMQSRAPKKAAEGVECNDCALKARVGGFFGARGGGCVDARECACPCGEAEETACYCVVVSESLEEDGG